MVNAAQIVKVAEGSSPFVEVSSDDLNHIILPDRVDKAYTSSNKPIDITVEGKHAFIKILDPDYHAPIEVFFIGDNTYSLILVPTHVPTETIILTSSFEDKEAALIWEREHPYEETIKKLMMALATENLPDGYTVEDMNKPLKSPFENSRLFLKSRYAGADLVGDVYFISNMSSGELMLKESDFYGNKTVAIAMETKKLAPTTSGHIYIIRRAGDER